MTALPDVNVLVALCWPDHIHHARARSWFAAQAPAGWATTALTELGLVRLSTNPAVVGDAMLPAEALDLLGRLRHVRGHRFWPDDTGVGGDPGSWRAVRTHRQVTDAHLVALARRHGGVLATLDRELATTHGSAVHLVS